MFKAILMLVIVVFSFISEADERRYSPQDSYKKADEIVVAVKIKGKLDCQELFELEGTVKLKFSKCEDMTSELSSDLITFNQQIKNEEYLVIKSIHGDTKAGDVISNISLNSSRLNMLRLYNAYLIFLHNDDDGVYYEYCDVVAFKDIRKYFEAEGYQREKLVEYLLSTDLAVCPKEVKRVRVRKKN